MIYDKVENMSLYFEGKKNFNLVEKAFKEFCASPFKNGSKEVDGENVFYNVSYYEPTDTESKKYEAHREYADVQIIFDGAEKIGVANIHECNIVENFKEGSDIAFMDAPKGQFLTVRKGYFMVLFPNDAHAPGVKSPESDFSHKLVFKVKL